ncbi:MAG: hypothetical protein KAG94_02285 [Clostridiales bacterium]|nr:hypothetical protein [Clostridiales bacterium]
MLQPINFVFFFLPLAFITGLYLLIVNLNKVKQPFGYQVEEPLDNETFVSLRSIYYKKVLYVSLPVTVLIPIISIFIKSFPIGAMLLTVCILGITITNFIFYLAGYNKIKGMQ